MWIQSAGLHLWINWRNSCRVITSNTMYYCRRLLELFSPPWIHFFLLICGITGMSEGGKGCSTSNLLSPQNWTQWGLQVDILKCSRCSVRQPRQEFPRKKNLEYMQTCHSCAKKLAERRVQVEKRPEREPGNVLDSPSRGRNGKGPQPRENVLRARLSWSEFIDLVTKHKELSNLTQMLI